MKETIDKSSLLNRLRNHPNFAAMGFTALAGFTIYGGIQAAENYMSRDSTTSVERMVDSPDDSKSELNPTGLEEETIAVELPDTKDTENHKIVNAPISSINGIKFDDGRKATLLLEEKGWIDPREREPKVESDGSVSLAPPNFDEVIEILKLKMYDKNDDIVYFSQHLGVKDGELVGYDKDGNIRPFAAIIPYHSYPTNPNWFPNGILELEEGATITFRTNKGLEVTFALDKKKYLKKVGEEFVWKGLDKAITGVDVVAAGCLFEVDSDGNPHRTEDIKLSAFEVLDVIYRGNEVILKNE